MVRVFVGVATTLGALLFVLGLALSLFSLATALMITGVLMLAAGGAAAWYSGIEHELPLAAQRSSQT